MATGEVEPRGEARREAAPAAFGALGVLVALGLVSWAREWELLGLPWWIWLVVSVPALLLTIDLSLTLRGRRGLVRSRGVALLLLGLLVLGNVAALMILVAGLVTEDTADLTGGELLLTAFAIYTADILVFGLLFWELDAGGPIARSQASVRSVLDFRFPQDDNEAAARAGWRPQVWDYMYVSLTNSIAFSPTDAMPLSLRAKTVMALESAISAVTILLVAARAVNVLGT
jgi:hypothetical protein